MLGCGFLTSPRGCPQIPARTAPIGRKESPPLAVFVSGGRDRGSMIPAAIRRPPTHFMTDLNWRLAPPIGSVGYYRPAAMERDRRRGLLYGDGGDRDRGTPPRRASDHDSWARASYEPQTRASSER